MDSVKLDSISPPMIILLIIVISLIVFIIIIEPRIFKRKLKTIMSMALVNLLIKKK